MYRLLLQVLLVVAIAILPRARAAENIMVMGVPDYAWYVGCFGTASGNLMGFWDRNGFPGFYTGPTADGVAPLNSFGSNRGIRSMWASKAGFDGRPNDQPGHVDDYWTYLINDANYSYESTEPDPYVLDGRIEHDPDSICDFMGSSQNKWSDLQGECSGNIDAFTFNFWEKQGAMRTNYAPEPAVDGVPMRDVQSGLRQWTEYREYEANVGSQLVDFNPEVRPGSGFTFQNLKAEILHGNPVLLMLQNPGELSRALSGMPRGNPNIHAMLAYHFVVTDSGEELIQFRTSWASGESSESWSSWGPQIWAAQMTLRGVIVFHPLPKITRIERTNGQLTIRWDGPQSVLWDEVNQIEIVAQSYRVEQATSLGGEFVPVGDPTPERALTVNDPEAAQLYFRVKLTYPAYDGIASP